MKKLKWFAVLAAAVMGFGFVSCNAESDDSGENNQNSKRSADLVFAKPVTFTAEWGGD